MIIKIFSALIIFIGFAGTASAQFRVVTYHKNNGTVVSSRDSADYERIVTKPDSGSRLFNVTENYMNGSPKVIAKSTKIPFNSWEGQVKVYYPSGKLERINFYKNGKLFGDVSIYFPNGKLYSVREYLEPHPTSKPNDSTANNPQPVALIKTCNDSTGVSWVKEGNGHYIGYIPGFKAIFEEGEVKNGLANGQWTGKVNGKDSITFKERYQEGALIEGKSFNKATGLSFKYTQRYIYPQFAGGEPAFKQFLHDNLRYPAKAKQNKTQGRVYVSFIVEKNGSLSNIKIETSPDPELSQEALNVINLSPNWTPAIQYGETVRMGCIAHVTFSLNNQY